MSNDLSLKYKDTLLLLLSIREKLEPEGIFHENISQWHYRIVYMDRKEIEFTRYLDDIKSSLRSSIPSRFLNKNNVKLQSITQFIRSFS